MEKSVQAHLEKLQEKMPPMTNIPQVPTMLREYAKLLNKTATEATAKAIKTSLAISALSRPSTPEVPMKVEQHLAALHAANERAKKESWLLCQNAFETSHIRMDNVNESLTFSIENIQVQALSMVCLTDSVDNSIGGNPCDYKCPSSLSRSWQCFV
ncbi:hypothetical protein AC1031_003032 [Aphanomyces cochlioides]|nr:hypothetical protein AC1031_003032 [Aphanomyces cochlioides]